ncbi:hypothetical protein AB6813_00500 [bacterium RCC_150]
MDRDLRLEGGSKAMGIKEQWHRIDPATQRWLTDHPGSVILPRTLSTIINNEIGESGESDQHGELVLSTEDQQFIQALASKGGNGPSAAPPPLQ